MMLKQEGKYGIFWEVVVNLKQEIEDLNVKSIELKDGFY